MAILTKVPAPKKYIHQGPTVQQTFPVPPIFNFANQNDESVRNANHRLIEPVKRFDGPISSQIQIFHPFTFESVTIELQKNYRLIEPVKRFDGAIRQDTFLFYKQPLNTDGLTAPNVPLANPGIHSVAAPQTYVFKPFPFDVDSAFIAANFRQLPLVTRSDIGPSVQQTYLFFKYDLDKTALDAPFIPPKKSIDNITTPQSYEFHPFPFDVTSADRNNNFRPIPVKSLAEQTFVATPQMYEFKIFPFDRITAERDRNFQFQAAPKSQLLITIIPPVSTGFWCSDTGMSAMTAGGSINDLGGY